MLELPGNMPLAEYLKNYKLNHIQLVEVKLTEKSDDKPGEQPPQKSVSHSEISVTIGLRGYKYEAKQFLEKELLEFKLVSPTMQVEGDQPVEEMQQLKQNEKEPIVLDKSWEFW